MPSKLRWKGRNPQVQVASPTELSASWPSLQSTTNLGVRQFFFTSATAVAIPAAVLAAANAAVSPPLRTSSGTVLPATIAALILAAPNIAVSSSSCVPEISSDITHAAAISARAPSSSSSAANSATKSGTSQLTSPGTGAAITAAICISTQAEGAAALTSPSAAGINLETTVKETSPLWELALDKVRAKGRGQLDGELECDIRLVDKMIGEIDQKKKECDEKRWFYISKDGRQVFFVETLLKQLNRYALIGDIAIQQHPNIVALAWAGFRLLLQDGEIILIFRLEPLTLNTCELYSGRKLKISEIFNTSLVNLYVSILEYICYAKEYLQKDTKARILASFFSELGRLLGDVQSNEKEIIGNADIAEKEASDVGRFDQEERTLELKQLLVKVQRPIENIERFAAEIYGFMESERRLKILGWLSNVMFSSHHSFSSGCRQSDTGRWLLENKKFLNWRSSASSSILWLRGDAGSGKTILASFVIDEFLDQAKSIEHALAYFYYDYTQTERREPASILRALVKQFCLKNPGNSELFPTPVLSAYQKREQDGHSSDSLSIKESKNIIVNLSEMYSQTIIVIDALDECDQNTRRELFSAIYEIVTSTSRVKVFLTSRYDSDIEEFFSDFPSHYIDASDNSRDINMYIDKEVRRRCDPKQRHGAEKLLLKGNVSPALKNSIISTLQYRANGMFMWAHLQILALCEEHTPGGIEKALDTVPKNLKATYIQILERIDSQSSASSHTAKTVLKWLLYARGSCSTDSVIQALAVKPGERNLNEDGLNWTLQSILSICENLVVHDEKLQNLRFAHFSVKEFLLHHPEFQDQEENHTYMAGVCLTALTYHHHSVTQTSSIPALIHYSVCNWVDHVRLSSAETNTLQTLGQVFFQRSLAYAAWVSEAAARDEELYVVSDFWSYGGDENLFVSPLWAACYCSLYDTSKYLLEQGEDPNERNLNFTTPLSTAAGRGDERMVQLLLDGGGVDLNSKDMKHRTPLSLAEEEGHEKVVQLFLGKDGVDVNPKDVNGRTPLSLAAANGHEKVVQLLLGNDRVVVDSKDEVGWTPLCLAATEGHKKVVKLLLDKDGVDMNTKDINDDTPLSLAAGKGHEKVVQLLLDKDGVCVNPKNKNGRVPLSLAVREGHEKIVQLLLDKGGADVDSKDANGRTLLSLAAKEGHEEVVRLLLEKDGVDINPKDVNGFTPLSWAAWNNHKEVVKLLLDKDRVDVTTKDMNNGTPLSLAAEEGHEKVVQLLLDKDGIDMDPKDVNGRTPLSLAAKKGHKEVVQLLLDKDGVDANPEDVDGCTSLSLAAANGHDKVVQLLLDKDGVDVNPKDVNGRTPLSLAAEEGHEKVVQLLLDKDGVDVNPNDVDGSTPLSLAVASGHEKVVQLMLDNSQVAVDSKDEAGRTPLSVAAEYRHTIILRMLEKAIIATSPESKSTYLPNN